MTYTIFLVSFKINLNKNTRMEKRKRKCEAQDKCQKKKTNARKHRKKGHEDVKHFFEYYHNSFHRSSR